MDCGGRSLEKAVSVFEPPQTQGDYAVGFYAETQGRRRREALDKGLDKLGVFGRLS